MNILIRFKDALIEALKEHKKLIIIFYILFIIIFIISWIYASQAISTANLPNIANQTIANSGDTTATELFLHNEFSAVAVYLCSIFFGIASIALLVYDAINVGSIGALFSAIMPKGGLQFILYLIPHGIFEITASVIQTVAGVLLFLFAWRFIKNFIKSDENGFKNKLRESYELNKKVLIQSVVLMIFVTILLLIAAPIEAYFSIPFSEFIVGI